MTNAASINLIKSFEGCKLTAYPDPGTGGEPWTIGYGHTGPDVHKGLVITQAQADALLVADLQKFETGVAKLIKVDLTENQKGALVSFAYNCGLGNLTSSTLLKKVNAKDFAGARAEFGKWTKAAGSVLPGLVKRRAAEAELFAAP
ncbi:lysozyme [Rhizobium sp.]|uniref:lysozyme n=1 Tax=Rhizobium sp. TaxID=391 RepID=UPI0034C5D586